ncbi:MAG: M48 family metallopeptidase [Halopseudomonas sp.]
MPKRQLPLITALLFSAVLFGCATPHYQPPKPAPTLQASETEQQQLQAMQHLLAQQQRLSRVAWPLMSRNTAFCDGNTKPIIGLQYANSHSFDEKQRDTALRGLQLGEALQVLSVTPGAPAEQSGVQAGDRLVSLNDQPLKTGQAGLTQAAQLFQSLSSDKPAKLVVYRQHQSIQLSLTPVTACDYPLTLVSSDQVNAYADNRSIAITEGMLNFTPDDRDLALVIAHELAHNALGHIPATARNALLGSSIDLLLISQGIPSPGLFTLGGLMSYSQAFETEADYVSLYLLARADYPLEGSADFWRRMSQSRPNHINAESSDSHPGTADRYLIMQASIDEIEQKRRDKQPLRPQTKF